MADMEDKLVLGFLKALQSPPIRWKVTGPGGKTYRIKSQTDRNISNSLNSGEIEFVIEETKPDGSVAATITMIGDFAADGHHKITKDGVDLPEPLIDLGIAGGLRFPISIRAPHGSVIVKFEWKDAADPDGRPDFRFEGRV